MGTVYSVPNTGLSDQIITTNGLMAATLLENSVEQYTYWFGSNVNSVAIGFYTLPNTRFGWYIASINQFTVRESAKYANGSSSEIIEVTGEYDSSLSKFIYDGQNTPSGAGISLSWHVNPYSSLTEAKEAVLNWQPMRNITYRLTNCTAPDAPQSASSGSEVTVPLIFTEGFGVNNPSTDAYVMNNGVLVPSTYANGVLTFTMP